eukprot:CAMPEP_0113854304 /NCGR_PEP_ID=MMETSP0372-20130328/7217_1 /TAXON_ID=340204 /ORGANISM="Lankesteria abbotti" /LENGTH=267 /DNA_ID=CAMNT_0000827401 /DNA_START=47 /DNA_END=845 /DNA_ORIENTATION=+ /assembly_acc=CAM_ASM_000359
MGVDEAGVCGTSTGYYEFLPDGGDMHGGARQTYPVVSPQEYDPTPVISPRWRRKAPYSLLKDDVEWGNGGVVKDTRRKSISATLAREFVGVLVFCIVVAFTVVGLISLIPSNNQVAPSIAADVLQGAVSLNVVLPESVQEHEFLKSSGSVVNVEAEKWSDVEEVNDNSSEEKLESDQVDNDVDQVDNDVDQVDNNVDQVDNNVDQVDNNVDQVDNNVDQVDNNVDQVDNDVDQVDNNVDNNVDQVDNNVDQADQDRSVVLAESVDQV